MNDIDFDFLKSLIELYDGSCFRNDEVHLHNDIIKLSDFSNTDEEGYLETLVFMSNTLIYFLRNYFLKKKKSERIHFGPSGEAIRFLLSNSLSARKIFVLKNEFLSLNEELNENERERISVLIRKATLKKLPGPQKLSFIEKIRHLFNKTNFYM